MAKAEIKFDDRGSWIWKDNDAREPNLALFIHGYDGDPESTWVRFPYLLRMAGEGFEQGWEIANYGYKTGKTINMKDLDTIAGLLLTLIDAHAHENENIFIIAHSLGGLVARRFLVNAFNREDSRAFFEKVRQVHFIGTPHTGAAPKSAKLAKPFNVLLSQLRKDSPILRETLASWNEILGEAPHRGVSLPKMFNYVGSEDWLVPLRQVITGFNKHEHHRIVDGGHISIAKPHNTENSLYKLVKRSLLETVENPEEELMESKQVTEDDLLLARPASPPPAPEIFVGRDDALVELKKRLGIVKAKVEEPFQVLTAMRGWPGVGKTSLAAVLAHEQDIKARFKDGVLWATVGQYPNLLSEMATWGRALGSEDILRAPTLKEATERLANLLRHRNALLIVDDVWEADHAEPFRQARGENCALLITTRETETAQRLAPKPEGVYNLDVLKEEYALKLLAELAPKVVEAHPDKARELVNDLECLPLAIHVAGRMLQAEFELGWGIDDLLKDLREGAALLEAKAPNDRFDYEKETTPTVAALLKNSSDRLDEQTRECFAFLGAFAPKPATFDLAAMQFVWEVEDAKPIARELVNRGLLEPVGGRFQMHALLVAHARSLCEDDEPEASDFEDSDAPAGQKIFLSYNQHDREFAQKLAEDLKANGHDVWWDQWSVKAGDSIVQKIDEGLRESGWLAVILSPEAVASNWLQHELNSALKRRLDERNIKILPILHKDCDLPAIIDDLKFADFRKDYAAGLQEVLEALTSG